MEAGASTTNSTFSRTSMEQVSLQAVVKSQRPCSLILVISHIQYRPTKRRRVIKRLWFQEAWKKCLRWRTWPPPATQNTSKTTTSSTSTFNTLFASAVAPSHQTSMFRWLSFHWPIQQLMASNNLKISTLKNLDSSILKFHLMKRNDKDKIEKKNT